MILTIVVAIASNNAIGKNNQLLWRMPADLKHFKEITTGHSIIMGRKTYDSVGKALPNRRNIVITRQNIEIPGCEVARSLEEAISLCNAEPHVFIIGGAEIYRQSLPQVKQIFLTVIHHDFEADTFFPDLNKNEWRETKREDYKADEKNQYDYSFITLERA